MTAGAALLVTARRHQLGLQDCIHSTSACYSPVPVPPLPACKHVAFDEVVTAYCIWSGTVAAVEPGPADGWGVPRGGEAGSIYQVSAVICWRDS